jgi:hypothetical protein
MTVLSETVRCRWGERERVCLRGEWATPLHIRGPNRFAHEAASWSHTASRTVRRRAQKMALERGAPPKLPRRTCSPRYGLQYWGGRSAGVAKRPRERSPLQPDSQLFHRCMRGPQPNRFAHTSSTSWAPPSMPGFRLARGSAWAGGRDHTLSRAPQRWGTPGCREAAPLAYGTSRAPHLSLLRAARVRRHVGQSRPHHEVRDLRREPGGGAVVHLEARVRQVLRHLSPCGEEHQAPPSPQCFPHDCSTFASATARFPT